MAFNIDVDIAGIKAMRNRLQGKGASGSPTEALRKRLVRVWQQGGDLFVRTALRKVAVDTGMSAATFYALSKALKTKRALNSVEAKIASPPVGQRKGVPEFPGGRRRPGIQDTKEGKKLGERAYSFSFPTSTNGQFVFKFSFQTVSWQMAFHDQGVEALTDGIDAFEAHVAREFEDEARFVLTGFFKGKTVFFEGD